MFSSKPMSLQQADDRGTTEYVVLEDGEAQAAPVAPVHVVVVETIQRRKRSFLGGCCCCCSAVVLLVMLLTLLVPRNPRIQFGDFVLGQSSSSVYNLMIDLHFKSRQPVETKWKDLDVTLEWLMPNNDDYDKIVEVAKFKESGAFKTSAFGKKRVYPELSNLNLGDTALLYGDCLGEPVQVSLIASNFGR